MKAQCDPNHTTLPDALGSLFIGAAFLLLILKINALIYQYAPNWAFLPSVPPYMQSGRWIVGFLWASWVASAIDIYFYPQTNEEEDGDLMLNFLALVLFLVIIMIALFIQLKFE